MAKSPGAQYWQEHVEAWRRSGLTQTVYCAEQSINSKTFYRWRRKILPASTAQKPQTTPLTLIPVNVDLSASINRIALHSPGGWRIEITDSGPTWLADLLKQLP